MAIIANTFLTYDAIGQREELDDAIYNVAPTDTPFMSACKKGSISSRLTEWQTDTLTAAAVNTQLEGNDYTSPTAVTPTVRLLNRSQIAAKNFMISGTEEAVNKAGRKSETAYQTALNMKALKRDVEYALTAADAWTTNGTAVVGASGTARQCRGLEGWIATNDSFGAGGASPSYTAGGGVGTVGTDGTQRAFTETLLKDVMGLIAVSANYSDSFMAMMGPFNRRTFSSFTGNATRTIDAADKKLVSTIRLYASDYGDIKVVMNRFQRERTCFILDMDKWEFCTMKGRSWQSKPLAITGDAEKRLCIVEFTLKSLEERASGAVRDLTSS